MGSFPRICSSSTDVSHTSLSVDIGLFCGSLLIDVALFSRMSCIETHVSRTSLLIDIRLF